MEKLKQDVSHYQLYAGKTYIQYEQDKYSIYQNYLYKRAIYGLGSLSEQELATICSKKKQRINNVYKRAQTVLNTLKQKLTITYSHEIFHCLFPNSKMTHDILNYSEIDEKYKNTLTFKDLKVSKDDIISIFIAEGILPKNFLSLENAPISLPSLKNENNT
jgi:hypothetical protein